MFNNKKKILSILLILSMLLMTSCSLSDSDITNEIGDTITNVTEELENEIGNALDSDNENENVKNEEDNQSNASDYNSEFEIPKFNGEPYIIVNNNKPYFTDEEKDDANNHYEFYGKLDNLGRCTYAMASLSLEMMPDKNEKRGDISSIHPSGWKSKMNWERLHLIGWQLSAENANENNLTTGTHYCNVTGMLPFENDIDDYIEETGNHVLYRVTPIFNNDELIARGILMEAYSVEDNGNGICFNVYCFNVTPGAEIDYYTGVVNTGNENNNDTLKSNEKREYVLNTNSKKIHYPSCSGAMKISEKNKEVVNDSKSNLLKQGYEPCGICEP